MRVALGARRAGRLGLACAAVGVATFAGVVAAVHVDRQMQRPNWRVAARAIGTARERMLGGGEGREAPLAYYLHARDVEAQTWRRLGVEVAEIETISRGHASPSPGRGFRLVEIRQRRGLVLAAPLSGLGAAARSAPRS